DALPISADHPHFQFSAELAHESFLLLKRFVESDIRRFEVEVADELARLARAVFAVHAGVFPLDRERALVINAVQRADDALEVDVAAADGTEVPPAAVVAEV